MKIKKLINELDLVIDKYGDISLVSEYIARNKFQKGIIVEDEIKSIMDQLNLLLVRIEEAPVERNRLGAFSKDYKLLANKKFKIISLISELNSDQIKIMIDSAERELEKNENSYYLELKNYKDKICLSLYDEEYKCISDSFAYSFNILFLNQKKKNLLDVNVFINYFDQLISTLAGYCKNPMYENLKIEILNFFKEIYFVFYYRQVIKVKVEDYRATLIQREHQLRKKDLFGDDDYKDWDDFLSSFIRVKLNLNLQHDFNFENFPKSFVSKFKLLNINKFYDIFAKNYIKSFSLTNKEKLDDSYSSVAIGVAYEDSIENLILCNLRSKGASVSRTPLTGDFGADLLFFLNGKVSVIQAKNYSGNVGLSAVQESLAAKDYYSSDFAIVVTKSKYTKSAISLAEKANVYLAHDHSLISLLIFLHK